MNSAAAIDVGSNAIRLAIGSLDSEGHLVVVQNYREAIRLGQDVFSNGEISEQAIERLVVAFSQFQQTIVRHGIKKVRAVATSAMREAANQRDVLKRIKERSGISLEVISGTDEARLVAEAVIATVDLRKKLALLIDIGGGSLEISLVDDGDVIFSDSVKLGAVRLLRILEENKKPPKLFHRLVRAYAANIRRALKKELRGRDIAVCVGTGGNLDELIKLREIILKKESSDVVSAKELDEISDKLLELSFEDRVKKLGLREDRADVIVPASIVLQAILKHADVKHLTIPRVGLKEGILLDVLGDGKRHSPDKYRKQLLAFVKELGARFDIDSEHASVVQRLSRELFEKLRTLHRFDEEAEMLLEVAAYLHDIGYAINLNDHHLHGAYIIRATPFVGLTEKQRNIVALLIRFHRKGTPKGDHPELAEYNKEEKERIAGLSAILRIAEALDKSHSGVVKKMEVERGRDKVTLHLHGEGDFVLERWAVTAKGELFQKVFDKEIRVAE